MAAIVTPIVANKATSLSLWAAAGAFGEFAGDLGPCR